MNTINTFNGSTDIEEFDHYRDRLQEVLQSLIVLDESVHDLLDDEKYAGDAEEFNLWMARSERCERPTESKRKNAEKRRRILQENRKSRTHNQQ
jgi:hypothetical protein